MRNGLNHDTAAVQTIGPAAPGNGKDLRIVQYRNDALYFPTDLNSQWNNHPNIYPRNYGDQNLPGPQDDYHPIDSINYWASYATSGCSGTLRDFCVYLGHRPTDSGEDYHVNDRVFFIDESAQDEATWPQEIAGACHANIAD